MRVGTRDQVIRLLNSCPGAGVYKTAATPARPALLQVMRGGGRWERVAWPLPPQAAPSAAGWLSWCLLFVLHWLLPFCRVSQSFALLRWWVRQLLRAVRRWFAPCAMATKITWFPTALNQATKRQLISATESMALAAVCHSCTLTLQHSDNRCVSCAGHAPTTMRDGHQNHWLPTALNQATKRQLISATESMALA